jgi:oligopeptide/dipeptide ABC transporter ATP-binding protein
MAGTGTAHLRPTHSLLRVQDLQVDFKIAGGTVQAVSGISFDVQQGETLGIVGESGCGKSTTGRAVLRLGSISSGSVDFAGHDVAASSQRQMRELRQRMQMIFQNPIDSLNPRRKVIDLVAEGLEIAGVDAETRRSAAATMLERVGLDPETFGQQLARSLSGGQAQRVAIARALLVEPELLVCDEAVSALDVSVQAQILNLLEDLKEQLGLTMVFIAHDLGVVRTVSDRVMVLYLGKVCEFGEPEAVYASPAHPYTRALLDSIPRVDKGGEFSGPAPTGDLPSPLDPPSGCRFRTRCPRAEPLCAASEPEMREATTGQFVACHFPL